MPIKPENKHRYPKDWKQIREQVLNRADHCCENCRVKNREDVVRGFWNGKEVYQYDDGSIHEIDCGLKIGETYVGDLEEPMRYATIVLTIAHLDHNPENNAWSNLKALCQQCHNRHDAEHRKANRMETMKQKKQQLGIQELPL